MNLLAGRGMLLLKVVKTAGEASALLEHDHACNPYRLPGCQ
jgi:hypothetical protein